MSDILATEHEIDDALPGKASCEDMQTLICRLNEELVEARAKIEEFEDQRADRDADADDCEETLWMVRYWMHDVLVLGKPMTDPRVVLRKIDEVLSI